MIKPGLGIGMGTESGPGTGVDMEADSGWDPVGYRSSCNAFSIFSIFAL